MITNRAEYIPISLTSVWRKRAERSPDLEYICAVHATRRPEHAKMQYADTRSAPQVNRDAHIYTMGLAYLGNRAERVARRGSGAKAPPLAARLDETCLLLCSACTRMPCDGQRASMCTCACTCVCTCAHTCMHTWCVCCKAQSPGSHRLPFLAHVAICCGLSPPFFFFEKEGDSRPGLHINAGQG